MTWITVVLSLLAAVSAVFTVLAKYRKDKRLEYIFKPLTLFWIILLALLSDDPISTEYKTLVLGGLVVSMLGDIFLMLPDHFLAGLFAFLLAHVAYIGAFTQATHELAPLYFGLPFLLYALLMLGVLWPYLGSLRGPVVIYMLVIMLMAWQAANRWLVTDESAALFGLVGAYLFVTSDSVLAVERFRGTWRSAPFWVLSTYFIAQWLIALSIHRW